ncbi:MAG: ATP-dependent DNA helicase RecG [Bacteroidota bacterium]|nr:ATP-dependent DNA helicase RecG [Bacteroidota bacterium]
MAKLSHSKADILTPVQFIKGIGPKRAEIFALHGIKTVRDLLYYFPFDYLNLTEISTIGSLRKMADTGKLVSVVGTVRAIDIVGRPPRRRCIIIIGDQTGTLPLLFFQNINYFKLAFQLGETIAVSGKINSYMNRSQIVHPRIDRVEVDESNDITGFLHTKGFIPKYSSNEDFRFGRITDTVFRKIMKTVVEQFASHVEEILSNKILAENNLIPLTTALHDVHFPLSDSEKDIARFRLKFDEWFFFQLLLAYRKKKNKVDLPGIPFKIESKLARRLVDSLPFKLTKAQIHVIKEIANDMRKPKPMNRLLQGDVGSGKTVVAIIAMLIAIENGYQVAFMAPTEILAEQHYRTFKRFLDGLPVNVRLLIGGQRKALREDVLEDIRRGTANIIVGTHALIQEKVEFANVGLVIIDEQHRFGVAQRAELMRKGKESIKVTPDVIVMTATPIPRTLSLTVYGDLDVSVIDEMPKDRKSIKTLVMPESQSDKLHKMMREHIQRREQVYIIYPIIEESEKVDLKAAVENFEILRNNIFPDLRVALIHGRMSSEEKDKVMDDFKNKRLDILVSTTVIEVGIDIPNATLMVIEHAERFGLSQLHQLRGRVGRGADQSYCILIVPDWLAKLTSRQSHTPVFLHPENRQNSTDLSDSDKQKALTRILTMLETSDGFKIAEVDLKLRGPGDFFGTRQSGLPELHIANVLEDRKIILAARKEAFHLVDSDPHLRAKENQCIRKFFYDKLKDSLNFFQVG